MDQSFRGDMDATDQEGDVYVVDRVRICILGRLPVVTSFDRDIVDRVAIRVSTNVFMFSGRMDHSCYQYFV